MSRMQDRIDVTAEINAYERICSFDEARLNVELRKAGVEPEGMAQRLEAALGLRAQTASQTILERDLKAGKGLSPHLPLPHVSQDPEPSAAPATPAAAKASSVSALETFEVAGNMKFFNASRGFGFFVADDGQGDVLVHICRLQAAGYRTVYEGARIHALVQRTSKGLQVSRILTIDQSSAVHPSQIAQRTREKVQAESGWVRAIVKWYNRPQGYGFAREGDGSPDCFLHADVLQRWGVAPPWPGQMVEIRWGMSSRGRMVAEIRHPDGLAPLPPVH